MTSGLVGTTIIYYDICNYYAFLRKQAKADIFSQHMLLLLPVALKIAVRFPTNKFTGCSYSDQAKGKLWDALWRRRSHK